MNGKKILITKDQKRSKNLEGILKKYHYHVHFSPLFDVKYLNNTITDQDFGAVIVTSAIVVAPLTEISLDKNIRIFSVGKFTTLELKNAGFTNIKTAPNQDANSLKELVISDYKENKEILYLCGDKITLDFKRELAEFNIKVRQYVSYQTNPRTEINKDICGVTFDYILIFSKNSAKIFLNLVNQNQELKDNFKLAKILCLSNKIADEFQNSDFKNISNFSELDILQKHYL
ncbi:MAG: uroporphyrinogen-III synthase [Rickettsiales bacterium]|nr:uroporphyrinogen-III synthase [Rickettsiales bacterium]